MTDQISALPANIAHRIFKHVFKGGQYGLDCLLVSKEWKAVLSAPGEHWTEVKLKYNLNSKVDSTASALWLGQQSSYISKLELDLRVKPEQVPDDEDSEDSDEIVDMSPSAVCTNLFGQIHEQLAGLKVLVVTDCSVMPVASNYTERISKQTALEKLQLKRFPLYSLNSLIPLRTLQNLRELVVDEVRGGASYTLPDGAEALSYLSSLEELRVLKLAIDFSTRYCNVEPIGTLKSLQELHLYRIALDHSWMTQLTNLTSLCETGCTDRERLATGFPPSLTQAVFAGCTYSLDLTTCTNIRHLELFNCTGDIQVAGDQLEKVYVGGGWADGRHLRALAHLTTLKVLCFSDGVGYGQGDSPVSDNMLPAGPYLSRLEVLRLGPTMKAPTILGEAVNLRVLDASAIRNFDDAFAEALKRMPKLEWVDMPRNYLPARDWRRLQLAAHVKVHSIEDAVSCLLGVEPWTMPSRTSAEPVEEGDCFRVWLSDDTFARYVEKEVELAAGPHQGHKKTFWQQFQLAGQIGAMFAWLPRHLLPYKREELFSAREFHEHWCCEL